MESKQNSHRRRWIGILLGTAIAVGSSPVVQAGGLSCSIGEVVIKNLKIGQTYSLTTLANLPLAVTNTGDRLVNVKVEPVIPQSSQLRQNALALPDLSWATTSPESFSLAPKETKQVEITLMIPDDESLYGAKYQVNLWSHTRPDPGEMLAYGLMSRVIFTIDSVRETEGVVPIGNLGISLAPDEIVMTGLVRGAEYSLDDFVDKPLSVSNTTDQSLVIELAALSANASVASPTPGYEDLLGAASVVFSPEKFVLEPGENREISGTVTFPTGSVPEGTNFMCVISAAVVGLPVQTQTYSRIYAHLK